MFLSAGNSAVLGLYVVDGVLGDFSSNIQKICIEQFGMGISLVIREINVYFILTVF